MVSAVDIIVFVTVIIVSLTVFELVRRVRRKVLVRKGSLEPILLSTHRNRSMHKHGSLRDEIREGLLTYNRDDFHQADNQVIKPVDFTP